ncbi:MAG TPA: hypothetical protein PKA10_14885 [Selenomonadales bacterium]|nr:hypothetical protein [Selenomonadales bacterium]
MVRKPALRLVLATLLLCLFAIGPVSAEIHTELPADYDSLEGVSDIPGTGQHEGYKKLVGHKLEQYYDIYFKYENTNGVIMMVIDPVALKAFDPDERIAAVLPDNGEERTATRENWYKAIRHLRTRSPLAFDLFQERNPDLVMEWALYDSGLPARQLAEKYIQKTYGFQSPADVARERMERYKRR